MDYLYITLNKDASQYAISLDEIFLTLYGFDNKKKLGAWERRFRRRTYNPPVSLIDKEIPGVVYRIRVNSSQHDDVRDILCDFLMESQRNRYRVRSGSENFSSAEFIAYILDESGIIDFADSVNGIAEEDLADLEHYEGVDVIYEGDLKKYQAANSCSKHTDRVSRDEKVPDIGIARYEHVPG